MQKSKKTRVVTAVSPSTPSGSAGNFSSDESDLEVDSFESDMRAKYGEGSVERYRKKLLEEFEDLKTRRDHEDSLELKSFKPTKESLLREAQGLVDAVKAFEDSSDATSPVRHEEENRVATRTEGVGEDGEIRFKRVASELSEEENKEAETRGSELTGKRVKALEKEVADPKNTEFYSEAKVQTGVKRISSLDQTSINIVQEGLRVEEQQPKDLGSIQKLKSQEPEEQERAAGTKGAELVGTAREGDKEAPTAKATWADVLGRSNVGKKNLKFVSPTIVNGKPILHVESKNFTHLHKKYEMLVVGSFVGKRPNFSYVREIVSRTWRLKNGFTMLPYGETMFTFKFESEEDRLKVLDIGSFHIASKLVIIRPWKLFMEDDDAALETMPIWVVMKKYPIELWDEEGFSQVGSAIGIPLFTDKPTEERKRTSFARVCIEIKADCGEMHS